MELEIATKTTFESNLIYETIMVMPLGDIILITHVNTPNIPQMFYINASAITWGQNNNLTLVEGNIFHFCICDINTTYTCHVCL